MKAQKILADAATPIQDSLCDCLAGRSTPNSLQNLTPNTNTVQSDNVFLSLCRFIYLA